MTRTLKHAILTLATISVSAASLAAASTPAIAAEGLGIVKTFAAPGTSTGELSLTALGVGTENRPGSGVAVSSTGDVYVADTNNNRVEWFTPEGQYLGQFNGSGLLPNEATKKAPAALSAPEGIAIDNAPASPSKGDVYVADRDQNTIDKFSATGEFIAALTVNSVSSITTDPSGHLWVRASNAENTSVQEYNDSEQNTPLTPLVPFPAPSGSTIAVDSQENLYLTEFGSEVERFSSTGTRFGGLGSVCGGGVGSCGASGLAIDPATNDLLVDQQTVLAEFGPFGEPFQEPVRVSKPGTLGAGAGLAVSPVAPHEIYVADAATDKVVVFVVGSAPEAPETLEAEEIEAVTAVLHGELNPHGETGEVEYHFVYSTEGTCTGAAGAGTAPVPPGAIAEAKDAPVQGEATGLEPSSKYTACLVSENAFGVTIGNEVAFETLPAPPVVVSESAAVGEVANEVVLSAMINPDHSENETTDFFEYSTNKEEVENGTAAQVSGPGIAAGEYGPQQVSGGPVEIPVEATVYYRITATNGNGAPTVGAIASYTKVPVISSESVSDLTSLSVTLEATINPEFQNTTYVFEYAAGVHGKELLEHREGIPVPNGAGKIKENEPPTPVSVRVYSLQPGETYYYQVVTENKTTKFKGNANAGKPVALIKSFEASPPPTATTGQAENITGTYALLTGSINPQGTHTSYSFQYISETDYQTALARGASDPYTEGEATTPVDAGSGEATVTAGPSLAAGLQPGETYRYRLIATNTYGVQGAGAGATFTTAPDAPPAATTGGTGEITETAATLAGTIASNGAETSYGAEIGTEAGSYAPATGIATISGATSEPLPETITITGLAPGTLYHYRFRATNTDGTSYGEDRTFTTTPRPSLLGLPPEPPQLTIEPPALENEKKHRTTHTLKEKLAKALKACKKLTNKTKRHHCETTAHNKYKPHHTTHHTKHHH